MGKGGMGEGLRNAELKKKLHPFWGGWEPAPLSKQKKTKNKNVVLNVLRNRKAYQGQTD